MKFLALAAALTFGVIGLVFLRPSAEGAYETRVSPSANKDLSTSERTGSVTRFACTVTRVHDGDGPIWCAEGQRVRLTAIAAREIDETCNPGHPCPAASGASAQRELERLARGQVLTCEQTGTSYGRVTAWCWRPDGVELNCAMVENGYALRWERYDPHGRLCGR